jgi:hypothetical protein
MIGFQPSAPDSLNIINKKRAKRFYKAICFLVSNS